MINTEKNNPDNEEIRVVVESEWDKMVKRLLDEYEISGGDIPPEIAFKIEDNKEELFDELVKWIKLRHQK